MGLKMFFLGLEKQENPQRIPDPTAQFSHLRMRKENPTLPPTHGDGDVLKMIQSVSGSQGLKSKPRSLSTIYI